MSLVNYATREITCKIVYYGPGRSGKTTNLQYVHTAVPDDRKGEMVSIATETDRTLFFDFLPLHVKQVQGMGVRFQLYTVPGQVFYEATRRLVLNGADGVVFVADSAPEVAASNRDAWEGLARHLTALHLDRIPVVCQYNKRDLPNAIPMAELEEALNPTKVPSFEAVAPKGIGVFDTLKAVVKLVLTELRKGS